MKQYVRLVYFALLCSLTSIAQQFPIQVFANVIPPAPVHIYNYADAMTINSPLRVRLLLRDLSITNRRIRLKVFIEGNGLKVQSRDQFIIGTPLFIDGGSPLVLNNTELAPYFELRNLQGIANRQYGQTLGEGAYQFCFEVYDFFTNRRLSRKSCATTFIFNNDPPLLNIPFNKSNIEPKAVDNIVFQWTPRQINVSNVEYEFSLVEIWDDHVDPNTAFLTSPPIFTTTTRATSFIYGPAHPLLLHNKRYAWRVQAKALKGSEEIGLFRNEGKSEVFWFSKNEKCPKLAGVHAEPKGISKINVYWEEDPATYSEYTIMYRQKDRPNSRWFHMRTNSAWATVWDLKPNTTYEYKVAGKCKYQYGEYSAVQYITTGSTDDPNANYNCGIVPEAIAITNREGHPNLLVGDRVFAGNFMVYITDIISQSNGVISGNGFVAIPYLERARFGVTFDNILVNTDYQLAEGEIVTIYDPSFGEGATMVTEVNITEWLNTIGEVINDLREDIANALNNGAITQEEAAQVTNTIAEQEEQLLQIKENDKAIEKLKEEGNSPAIEKLQEENKNIQKEVDQQLASIAEQLGINDKETNTSVTLQQDSYFDGLFTYGNGTTALQHQRLDTNETIDFNSNDATNPVPDELEYSFLHDGKEYTIIVTHSGTAPKVIESARLKAQTPEENALNLYLHYDTSTGTMGYTINFGKKYLEGLSQEDFEAVLALYQEAVFNKMNNRELDTAALVKTLKDDLLNTYSTFKQLLYEVKLPENLWDAYTYKGEDYYMESLTAGLTDGVVEEVKSIPLLISIVVDYTTDKNTRKKINDAISKINVAKIYNTFVTDRAKLYGGENTDKIKHQTGKDVVAVASTIGSGGLAASGKIKKGAEFIEELAEKTAKLGDDIVGAIDDLVAAVGDAYKAALKTDLESSPALVETFKENANLLDAWKVLDDAGVNGLTSKIDNIEIIDDFLKKYPSKLDNLKATLKQTYSPEDLLQSIKRFEEIPTISNTDELIDVLSNVTDINTISQLEQKGIKSFFRGTTRNSSNGALYPGNPNSQLFGISTSTDPIRGTIFAIESATSNPNFKGVLQLGLPADLGDLRLVSPNRRVDIELETIIKTSADDFANLSKVEISVKNARKLVKEVYNIDLPSSLDSDVSRELLETLDVSNLEKSLEFYQKALQYNTK